MRLDVEFKTAILIFFITSSILAKTQIAHHTGIFITDFKVIINAHKDTIN